ncbi:MAG: MarR family transcriptional regulator [Planctomycetota bacterium]
MNDDELARRLHSGTLRLLRRLRTADGSAPVSPARLSLLSILVFAGPRTVGELARLEQVSQPTISNLVAALEAEGLVRRVADPDDGRRREIRATPAGRRLLHAAREERERLLLGLLAPLGERDRKTLARATEILEAMIGG